MSIQNSYMSKEKKLKKNKNKRNLKRNEINNIRFYTFWDKGKHFSNFQITFLSFLTRQIKERNNMNFSLSLSSISFVFYTFPHLELDDLFHTDQKYSFMKHVNIYFYTYICMYIHTYICMINYLRRYYYQKVR